MKVIIALFGLVPALAWAGPFDGTWVGRLEDSTVTGKPDTYLVANGEFTCGACYPGLKIKADGSDQKVVGHAYYDAASAKVQDAQRVQMSTRAAGKLWEERTFTVSADGKTMTEEFISYQGPNPAKGKLMYSRVASGPAGAHVLSGSWQSVAAGSSMSSDLLTATYVESIYGLKWMTPTGQSFDAKFDGKQYLTAGDPGKTMVSLKRLDARTIQETDTRDGKVTDLIVYKVSADGKTMHVVDEDKIHGTKLTYAADKKAM
jgi:hypothetical protein